MKPDLYGITNCDSVKKARKWLESQGIDHRFHDFRKDGLAVDDLRKWIDAIGWEAVLNRRSTSWRQLSEADKTGIDRTRAERLMLGEPTLIKRPVLVTGDTVLTGFSVAAYREIFV